jgi:hypothetical protein
MQQIRVSVRGIAVVVLVGAFASGCSSTHHPAARAKTPTPTPTPKEAAVALGHQMLTKVVLPAGARVSTAEAPAVLRGPSVPGMGNLEFAHQLWTVPRDPGFVYHWLQDHVPHGFRKFETSTGKIRGVPSWGVDDQLASAPANISDAELQFGIAGNDAGGATVRVDTVVGWTDPRPANEYVSKADRTVIVTVVHVFPAGSTGKRVVTSDPKLVQPVERTFNRLLIAPPQSVHSCPPITEHTVSYRVEFATSATAAPDITATVGKCGGPSVTVRGHPAPSLVGVGVVTAPDFAQAVARVLGFAEPHFG